MTVPQDAGPMQVTGRRRPEPDTNAVPDGIRWPKESGAGVNARGDASPDFAISPVTYRERSSCEWGGDRPTSGFNAATSPTQPATRRPSEAHGGAGPHHTAQPLAATTSRDPERPPKKPGSAIQSKPSRIRAHAVDIDPSTSHTAKRRQW